MDTKSKLKKDTNSVAEPKEAPRQVRLPGFLIDEQIGLGDAVKKVTYALGIKPCGGCEQRASTLNNWIVLGPYGQKFHR